VKRFASAEQPGPTATQEADRQSKPALCLRSSHSVRDLKSVVSHIRCGIGQFSRNRAFILKGRCSNLARSTSQGLLLLPRLHTVSNTSHLIIGGMQGLAAGSCVYLQGYPDTMRFMSTSPELSSNVNLEVGTHGVPNPIYGTRPEKLDTRRKICSGLDNDPNRLLVNNHEALQILPHNHLRLISRRRNIKIPQQLCQRQTHLGPGKVLAQTGSRAV